MCVCVEKIMNSYKNHLTQSEDLITAYEATRAGFIALALEKNRQATPYIAEARTLQQAVSKVQAPADLLSIKGIESALLTAAGLSDKALVHLSPQNKTEALNGLIKNFLEPAGANFREELIFRFLLTRGDTLGGAMRNVGGVLAQKTFTRAIISTLTIAGIQYQWQPIKSQRWLSMSKDDSDIELALKGLSWHNGQASRTLIYNLKVPLIAKNVDICLFNLTPHEVKASKGNQPESYIALGELKGGIDPAGSDEHWKTAQTALGRVREGFLTENLTPHTFFVGAAIEKTVSVEIWSQLQTGTLTNAANLTNPHQVASLTYWLCHL